MRALAPMFIALGNCTNRYTFFVQKLMISSHRNFGGVHHGILEKFTQEGNR